MTKPRASAVFAKTDSVLLEDPDSSFLPSVGSVPIVEILLITDLRAPAGFVPPPLITERQTGGHRASPSFFSTSSFELDRHGRSFRNIGCRRQRIKDSTGDLKLKQDRATSPSMQSMP